MARGDMVGWPCVWVRSDVWIEGLTDDENCRYIYTHNWQCTAIHLYALSLDCQSRQTLSFGTSHTIWERK